MQSLFNIVRAAPDFACDLRGRQILPEPQAHDALDDGATEAVCCAGGRTEPLAS